MVAKRIRHTEADLPGPSDALMKSCAKAGYLAMAGNMNVRFDVEFTDWDDLVRSYKEVWEYVARSMYAIIAIEGGAAIEDIPNVENEDEDEDE